jgi:hypothetical protein
MRTVMPLATLMAFPLAIPVMPLAIPRATPRSS